MHHSISYCCVSHIGKIRSINQDNLVCDNRHMETNGDGIEFPLSGIKSSRKISVFGVFDGMGGEECGEIASYIAAHDASTLEIKGDPVKDLLQFCQKANNDICDYADKNNISSMGTTAAMLVFARKDITLCNIGDTKIFRFSGGVLEQISKDHVSVSVFGVKPPLSQNLGIPSTELIIDPYLAQGEYNDKDVYLICSDGLTDMVTTEEISEVLTTGSIRKGIETLLNKALENGGKDNVTIILLEIQRKKNKLLSFLRKNGGKE